jgi:hypothetical protein
MKYAMFVVLFAGVVAGRAAGEEKYIIKLKKEAAGDVIRVNDTSSENTSSSYSVMGNAQRKDAETRVTSVFTEEILEKKPGERPTKLRRSYEKGEAFKDGKTILPSFLGKTVLVECQHWELTITGHSESGAQLAFTVDGKALSGDDADFLNRELKNLTKPKKDREFEDFLLPKRAVALRETWRPEMAAIADYFSEDARLKIDQPRSTAAGRLLNAYSKNGKQFGVFEVTLELALAGSAEGHMPAQFEPGSKAKISWRYEGCIDGSCRTGAVDVATDLQITSNVKVPDGTELKFDTSMHRKVAKTRLDLTRDK